MRVISIKKKGIKRDATVPARVLCVTAIRTTLAFLLLVLGLADTVWSDDDKPSETAMVQSQMQSLYTPLKELLPYLASLDDFRNPSNRDAVSRNLNELRNRFHTVEAIPSRYKNRAGFAYAVTQVRDILDDSTSRLGEGKVDYAWWRSRVLPNACFACHATYSVESTFHPTDVVSQELPIMDRARFLLATRQVEAAEKLLLEVLATPEERINFGEAIRSLLTVEVRMYRDPTRTVTTLKRISSSVSLAEEDQEEVASWIKSLSTQKKQDIMQPSKMVTEGERLIKAGLPKEVDGTFDVPLLLLGTDLLQAGLAASEVASDHRRKALLLLGSAYARIPMFFADGWSGLYLELCIKEFPGTDEAKRAYKVYRDTLGAQFTGSSGTNFPAEVQLNLENLRKAAYGIPEFRGRL